MPEFDTYNAIARFAADNTDNAAYQAYRFLKHRTSLMIQWRALQYVGYIDFQKSKELYTGTSARQPMPEKLEDMTEDQRRELYFSACAQVDLQLDPSLFRNIKE